MVSAVKLRYGSEWLDLFVALIVFLLIMAFLTFITAGIACCWITFALLMTGVFAYIANTKFSEKQRASPQNMVPLYYLVQVAGERLEMKMPAVYVDASPQVNAYARGIISPIIVLNTGLLKIMEEEEVLFVIGHEMGHVKLRHTALKTLFESGMVSLPWYLYIPMYLFRLLFLHGRMSRSMEYSADRAGLYACNDLEAAVRVLLKLKTESAYLDPDMVWNALSMRLKVEDKPGLSDDISRLLSSHPDTADRINKLVQYSRDTGVGWKWWKAGYTG